MFGNFSRRVRQYLRSFRSSTTIEPQRAETSNTFSFRIRVNRSPISTINTASARIDLPPSEPNLSLKFISVDSDKSKSLKDATRWALVGEGYANSESASAAALRFQDALRFALAKCRLGADFGERSPTSVVTDYGIARLTEQTGKRVLSDVHGTMVFRSEPAPRFASIEMKAVVARSFDRVEANLIGAIAPPMNLTPEERLAITLFSASMFETQSDTRFILLVMAVEALIKPGDKSLTATKLIDDFCQQIGLASLDTAEASSLTGSLRLLRKELISRAGRRLALQFLADDAFGDMAPDKFFAHI